MKIVCPLCIIITDPCSPVSHTHEEKETCVSDIGHPESQKEGLKLLTLDVASAVPNEEKEEIVTDGKIFHT